MGRHAGSTLMKDLVRLLVFWIFADCAASEDLARRLVGRTLDPCDECSCSCKACKHIDVCESCQVVESWGLFPKAFQNRTFVYEHGACLLPFETYLSNTGLVILLSLVSILAAAGAGQMCLMQIVRSDMKGQREEKAAKTPDGYFHKVSFSTYLDGVSPGYMPLNKSEDEAPAKEVIEYGMTSWSLRQMRQWGDEHHPTKKYELQRQFFSKFVMGVGLPMFYSFQLMVALSAIIAFTVLYLVQYKYNFHTVLADATEFTKKYPDKEYKNPEMYEYAERMTYGLFFTYVVLQTVALLYARMQREFATSFDSNNSTMNDYTLKLTGLPPNLKHEEELISLVCKELHCVPDDIVGASIAYDLAEPEVQDSIWRMIEHRFVQADVAFYKAGEHPASQAGMSGKKESKHVALLRTLHTDEAFGYSAEMASKGDLDQRADADEFKRLFDSEKMRGSGTAFIVFQMKSKLDSIRMQYHGFWHSDQITVNTEQELAILKTSLGPKAIFSEVVDIGEKLHQRIASNYRIAGPEVEETEAVHFSYLKDVAVINDEDMQVGMKVFYEGKEPGVGEPFKVERLIRLDNDGSLEPTNFLWFNFGVNKQQRNAAMYKAMLFTGCVFMTIALVVYLPLYYYMDLPWSLVEGSPGMGASQVQGMLLAIAGNVLGWTNWQGLCRCGIYEKQKLDRFFLLFSLVTSAFNTVFFLSAGLWAPFSKGFNTMDMTQGGVIRKVDCHNEIQFHDRLFDTLLPGWLFSGMIVGKLMSWIMPLVQNWLLCTAVYRVQCFPKCIARILCNIIPGNPPPERLTARCAELVFNPPEVGLAWEYASYIVIPTVCSSMLFTASLSWKVFGYLALWVIVCYMVHRYPTLWISRKAMEGEDLVRLAEHLWGVPLATILAAASFWGIRCEILGAADRKQCYWMVLVVFIVGLCIHSIGMHEIGKSDHSFDVGDKPYHDTKRKLIYTWFNCNPVHVLKSAYYQEAFSNPHKPLWKAPLGLERTHKEMIAKIPFEYGKEYLQLLVETDCDTDEDEEEDFPAPGCWGTPTRPKNARSVAGAGR